MRRIKQFIDKQPLLKSMLHRLLVHDKRPTWIARWCINPWVHQLKGKIRRSARIDTFPFQPFSMGKGSVIEDYAVVNNGIGEITIGKQSRIGIGSVLIGPVKLGNHCLLAQHVVISGLNHQYSSIKKPISEQGVYGLPVVLEDGCWIGANVSILAGVTIGKNAIIGAGSVVTKDIPPYHLAVGNPAKVIKKYDHKRQHWVHINAKPSQVPQSKFVFTGIFD